MGEALIIVNDQQLGKRLFELFQRKGFTPRLGAVTAVDAAQVDELRPEVIFLDGRHEDGQALRLCQQLKLDPRTNLIPLIAVQRRDKMPLGYFFAPNAQVSDPSSAAEVNRAIDEAVAWRASAGQDGLRGELRVHLHSELGYLDELNKLLGQHFRQMGLGDVEAKQVTMAVRELGANAIEWGHRREVDRLVTLHSRLQGRRLTICISDTGPGFSRCDLPHAASQDDPVSHLSVREQLGLREGGFGIMIANGLVDELRYNEAGNEVCLIKNLGAAAEKAIAPQ